MGQRSEQTHTQRKQTWQIGTWKDAQCYRSAENYKWKQQWDTTKHLFEWLKYKTTDNTNGSEDVKQWGFPFIAGENAK